MRETLFDHCVRTNDSKLVKQWDADRNAPLTPQSVSYGSKKKVWWHCERGHIWQASVTARTCGGSGCPYCAGTKMVPGETDLAACYPHLAAQWHPVKNGTLSPADVQPGSHRRVWWVCQNGHEWQAEIKSRASGSGCPVCANRVLIPGENDLATMYPALAAQWDPARNGCLTPQNVLPGSHRKVWWLCEKGHVWQAQIAARVGGNGCPVCAGKKIVFGENDLETLFPAISRQWHPTRNGTLTPRQVSPYSNRKVWWLCEQGHTYQAAVAARTMRGSRCPYCAGRRVWPGFNDLATLNRGLAKQWHLVLNGSLRPEMVTVGSHQKIWWVCELGHVWKAVVYSRTGPRHSGCPVCAGKASEHRKNTLIESGHSEIKYRRDIK